MMIKKDAKIRLTQYSHGAGCGCKISPKILDKILYQAGETRSYPQLIVGNEQRDDAAVIDIGDQSGIVSTTDFFMPIVDDPFDFGRIAAVNAISDIYAMGATPIMAIAILGWPINILAPEIANQVVSGGRSVCESLNIPLAGGHSIDSPEPIFGLSVTGRVKLKHLKTNSGAKAGSKIYLTKALGVGILTTAEKKSILQDQHSQLALNSMLKVNSIGASLAKLDYVQAMTDVTGFGLGGHLTELCEASEISVEINSDQLPVVHPCVYDYIEEGAIPGGTIRNFDSYGEKISTLSAVQKAILCDPQTSGGLLLAVDQSFQEDFEQLMETLYQEIYLIGRTISKQDKSIIVT